MKIRKIRTIILTGALCANAGSIQALMPQEMTDAERRTLPPWCEFTQTLDSRPKAPGHYDDHVVRYGEGWTHVHHLCWALASILRYSRYDTTPQMKRTLATSALADIDYVLRNAPEDFVLRFEILTRKVRVLIMTGALSDAEALSKKVLDRWPERADSHGLVAEVLLSLNRRKDATETLTAAEPRVTDKVRLDQIRSALKL